MRNLSSGKRMDTILAIDDEVQNLEMVEYALDTEYEVIPVKSGKAALNYLKSHTPDLILLDIMMPEMDGMEVYQHIREVEDKADIPVIFLTSANDAEIEESCFDMGAVDFISKPFEPKIVLKRVTRTLELIRKGRNNGSYTAVAQNDGSKEDSTGKTLAVSVNGMSVQIYQKDIYYIEVFGNTCIIRTTNRELTVRETLEHMQEKLEDSFLRTGRSFILNTQYVAEIADDIVIMKNGKHIKLPRRNKKELIQEILKKTNSMLVL